MLTALQDVRAWHPEWVELPKASQKGDTSLKAVFGAPIRYGGRLAGISSPKHMLLMRNPRSREARNEILFSDMKAMIRQHPPRRTAELVLDTLRLLSVVGDFSEEVIAERLGIGKRTLQRRLSAEGHRFRDIVTSFQMKRAEALLLETDYSAQEIAGCLGYQEVNSFRRAFRSWAGMTPTEYSARRAGSRMISQ
ncbi:helix-turn-helix domain-containing protein [Aliiruegeria sabulilitoris]|uniref:helix-turn-helix domain-containing protein n=1 Tax=Aliiruegeria sabulilitoris TaxID=1510458 RepID=UPI0008332EB7|nr:helix-turn-helix transcriptional regulator [Aliiruegeria sabulilitoris]NDR56295.1 helix-turn-helix transcriptional regulator [Pseudoruegeria sp. M32A2M]